jgi:hypothetical protein
MNVDQDPFIYTLALTENPESFLNAANAASEKKP